MLQGSQGKDGQRKTSDRVVNHTSCYSIFTDTHATRVDVPGYTRVDIPGYTRVDILSYNRADTLDTFEGNMTKSKRKETQTHF